MTPSAALTADFIARRPTLDDLPGVVAVIHACDVAEGSTELGDATDDIRQTWTGQDFDLNRHAWVVTTAEGQVIGYEECALDGDGYFLDGYVHPAWANRGIGSYLLGQVAAMLEGSGAAVQVQMNARNTQAKRLFESFGYTWQRGLWLMKIHFDAPPPAPAWPEGFTCVPVSVEGNSRDYHAMIEDAFRDHWGSRPRSYEEWSERFTRQDFDPSLYFLVLAPDGTPAAGANCRLRTPDFGWVQGLGTRRAFRGRGLGMALLYQAFGIFYARGVRTIGLAVDSENPTGATRLYLKAGMAVDKEYETWGRTF